MDEETKLQVRQRTPECKTDDRKIGGGSDTESIVIGKVSWKRS